MRQEILTVVSTVAATLRVVAEWFGTDTCELLSVANQVETNWDDICCPLCEEILCDETCPLKSVRDEVVPDGK